MIESVLTRGHPEHGRKRQSKELQKVSYSVLIYNNPSFLRRGRTISVAEVFALSFEAAA